MYITSEERAVLDRLLFADRDQDAARALRKLLDATMWQPIATYDTPPVEVLPPVVLRPHVVYGVIAVRKLSAECRFTDPVRGDRVRAAGHTWISADEKATWHEEAFWPFWTFRPTIERPAAEERS